MLHSPKWSTQAIYNQLSCPPSHRPPFPKEKYIAPPAKRGSARTIYGAFPKRKAIFQNPAIAFHFESRLSGFGWLTFPENPLVPSKKVLNAPFQPPKSDPPGFGIVPAFSWSHSEAKFKSACGCALVSPPILAPRPDRQGGRAAFCLGFPLPEEAMFLKGFSFGGAFQLGQMSLGFWASLDCTDAYYNQEAIFSVAPQAGFSHMRFLGPRAWRLTIRTESMMVPRAYLRVRRTQRSPGGEQT